MSLLKVAGTAASSGTLYVNDVFSTYLYTGNGSTQTITNGIDLAGKGGLVWLKSRSDAYYHNLFDTNRGINNRLFSNNSSAADLSPDQLTAFNSSGFTLGASSSQNISPSTYTSWTFRKAAKFFDVQTVTHTNGTENNIDLSVLGTVGMVIAKITTTTGDWTVWQRSLTAGNNLVLNTSAAQSTTNAWLSVSGTTATLSASAPTGTYVIYAYAHDTTSTGIIQCGSFTTDAGGNATVNLGWEPQYLMDKARSAGGWNIYDTMRGWSYTGAQALYPNDSYHEVTDPANYIPTATGFNVTGYVGNVTKIYMAIRRPNKPPTTGTQVFSPSVAANGSGKTTTGFPVDMQMLDYRPGSAGFAAIVDRLRGSLSSTSTANNAAALVTNSQAAENTSTIGTQGFDNTGYTPLLNSPIYWNFARAPGFFDEVCYTGTGSTTTQAHNLTVVPELMIVKERSATNNWWVYDAIDGNTKYSVLNSTAIPVTSSTAWNNTTPTASVFSIGTATNVNASAQTYVAYLFATLAGISKVGSYTGNGTGQAIACGFGSAGARFVLIKRTDSTGDWYTFDSARGLTSGSSPYVLLNSTAAETTGNNGVYASSGGFTLGATAITTTNIATASYIFLAIA